MNALSGFSLMWLL